MSSTKKRAREPLQQLPQQTPEPHTENEPGPLKLIVRRLVACMDGALRAIGDIVIREAWERLQ